MNRQRRLDAIARRRAFIDSQIEMLSNTETRVPNIIRSRRGLQQPSKPRLSNIQGGQVVQIQTPSPSKKVPIVRNEAVSSTPAPSSSSNIGGESESTEEVYVAVIQDNDDEGHPTFRIEGTVKQGQTDGHFPIHLSEDIAKMFSGATDQPFQTIQTEDGTVMVVLEGNNFTENETETSNTASAEAAESSEVSLQPVPVPDPSVESTNEEITTTEYYEESYVIVQTPDGDILVPSSKLCSEFQTQTQAVSSGENVVQFLTTESGAIEHVIVQSSPSEIVNKKNSEISTTKVQQNVAVHGKQQATQKVSVASKGSVSRRPVVNVKGAINKNVRRMPLPKPKVPIKKIDISTKTVHKLNRDTQSISSVVTGGATPTRISCTRENEKPRPFRFELPELEDRLNDLDDCFMSVPVPITIGSLRSETEKSKIYSMGKSEMSLSHFSVAATNGGSICSGLEVADKDGGAGVKEKMFHGSFPETHLSQEETQTQGSASEDKISHMENNCNTLFQCGICFQIFNAESSITNHLVNCKNHNFAADVTSFTEDAKEESQLVTCNNTHFDYLNTAIKNEDTSDTTDMAENLIIKSVNSLSVPEQSPFVELKETRSDISSPVDSVDHEASNICADQLAPMLTVKSSDAISKNDNMVNYCVQLVGDSELLDKSQPSCKKAKLDIINSASNFLEPSNEVIIQISKQEEALAPVRQTVYLDNNLDVSRRTLDKVSASAKINLPDEMTVDEEWGNTLSKETTTDFIDSNGNKVTIQSARIRSRNDRLKALDENVTSKEQIGVNFLNIFEQVVKQNIQYN